MSEPSGCSQCHHKWPERTFKQVPDQIANGTKANEILCDVCLAASAVGTEYPNTLAEKIDEAQGVNAPVLLRTVEVSGFESKTNAHRFVYTTHVGMKPLIVTPLTVFFRKDDVESVYVFADVPVAVCEAWYTAPSKGGFFQNYIRNSYHSEKVR